MRQPISNEITIFRNVATRRTILFHGIFVLRLFRHLTRFKQWAPKSKDEKDEDVFQASPVTNDENLFCHKSESRRKRPETISPEDRPLEASFTGIFYKFSSKIILQSCEFVK